MLSQRDQAEWTNGLVDCLYSQQSHQSIDETLKELAVIPNHCRLFFFRLEGEEQWRPAPDLCSCQEKGLSAG